MISREAKLIFASKTQFDLRSVIQTGLSLIVGSGARFLLNISLNLTAILLSFSESASFVTIAASDFDVSFSGGTIAENS
jgi:hypothetical protein